MHEQSKNSNCVGVQVVDNEVVDIDDFVSEFSVCNKQFFFVIPKQNVTLS